MTITNGESTSALRPQELLDGRQAGLDEELLVAHYGWVRAVARNLVRDHWSAEDVTQETLLAALAAPPRDAADARHLRAWLGRVAFNLSRLGSRQGARRRARELRAARREALPSASEEIEAAASLRSLSLAIGELGEPYRSVVVMRYFDGLSTAEIAARTGTSELAVRKRLWRARAKLRAALDYDEESGQLFAALLPWLALSRRAAPQLAGLAAGLAAVTAVTWTSVSGARDGDRADGLAFAEPPSLRVELAGSVAPSETGSTDLPPVTGHEPPARRPWAPHEEPVRPPVVEEVDELPLRIAGQVLDLEGAPRAGLEIVDPAAPGAVLATTDLLGGFQLRAEALPERIEAHGDGWTTVFAEEPGASGGTRPLTLVVAPSLDLAGRVVDELGRGLDGVRLEVVCDESAWARVPVPVRLTSEVLRTIAADASGSFDARGLPRAAGLLLRVSRAGFEREERATLELEPWLLVVLRSLADEPVLAGRVLRQDGRPAAGATVELALASTTTDELGRFQLPLRGVQPSSALAARGEGAAPALVHDFGRRLQDGRPRDVELRLGDEHDRVLGRLLAGGRAADGWQVVAFPEDSAAVRLDARGFEEPAARASADERGDFELRLPRGAYALYALDPRELRLVRCEPLDTRRGRRELELPPPAGVAAVRGLVRTADGQALADARLRVLARADGPHGRRRIDWRELVTGDDGAFAFEADPAVPLELEAEHPGRDGRAFACTAGGAPLELALPAASFLQVAGVDGRFVGFSVLDRDGQALVAHGPLRAASRFDLRAGASPVLEVPAEARWLELRGGGAENLRLPLVLESGEIAHVRP